MLKGRAALAKCPVGCVRRGPPATPPACPPAATSGRPTCLADWTEMLDTRACLDTTALVRAMALEVHAQHRRPQQTDLQRKDPQRGPSPEAQPQDPAGRVLSCLTEPQAPEGEGSEPPHGQASDRDIPFAERWPLATAAARESTGAA